MSEFSFSDEDFRAMTHPEGAPGQLNAIYGDRGTAAVLQNTAALSQYYRAMAFRAEMIATVVGTFGLVMLLASIPALIMLWMVAV